MSNNASTDSWSILFSLRTIISGALRSISLPKRLFLFITLRYKSLRSEVANLPPSSGTSGLNSGGITGKVVKTIHSGLLPESANDSKSFNLLIVFSKTTFELIVLISSLNLSLSCSTSIFAKHSLIAAAPIPAENWSSPYSSCAFKYSSSEII